MKLNKIDIKKELEKITPRQWNQYTMHHLQDMQMLEKQFNMIINYANNIYDELEEVKKELNKLKNNSQYPQNEKIIKMCEDALFRIDKMEIIDYKINQIIQ